MRKFFSDMLPVIAGVLLALWAQGWADSRRDETRLQEGLDALDRAFTAHVQDIDASLPCAQDLADTLYTLYRAAGDGKRQPKHFYTLRAYRTFRTPSINPIDWQSFFDQSNLSRLPPEVANQLSLIHFLQLTYDRHDQLLGETFYEIGATRADPSTIHTANTRFVRILLSVMQTAQQLRQAYSSYHKLVAATSDPEKLPIVKSGAGH
jgi:hypothetical protein